MKFSKLFHGVPDGEVYPREYQPGDSCPPELEEGARSLDALESPDSKASRKSPADKAHASAPETK